MRYKDAIFTAIALIVGLTTLTGMTYTEQYQHAAVTESTNFDALAHGLFDGSAMACAEQPAGASVVQ